ncbi:MAG: N-acetylmuramoyl-L-alanine amidase [Gemmatimonadales bacterium]
MRGRRRQALLLAVALGSACGGEASVIPFLDGPLTVEVRYPTGEAVGSTDSIATWGTVGTGRATLLINGAEVTVEPNGTFATFVPRPDGPGAALVFEARRGSDTVRRSVPVPVRAGRRAPAPVVRSADRWILVRRPPSDTVDSATQARPVFSRWTPGGDLALPLTQGLRLRVSAETDGAVRLALAPGWAVWIPSDEAPPAPPPAAPRQIARVALSEGRLGWSVDAFTGEQLASHVDVTGERVRWTLFAAGATAAGPAPRGPIQSARVRDGRDGRVLIELRLAAPPLAWRVVWRDGAMRLELRERPRGIDGLVVALDPGHPPLGTVGPGGLHEDSVTLAVARVAAERLERLGARVVLTRLDERPVSIDQRLAIAEAANAHVFLSIHLNSPGEGRPPESVDGTRGFWLDPSQFDLAVALRDSVAAAMGQVPVATVQSNLAVLRATWFRSVLVEATALVLPAREAYFRTDAGVAAYADGLVRGLEAWAGSPSP